MHNLTLNISSNAYEHLIYFISNIKDDVEIIKDEIIKPLDIEVVKENDPDYKIILQGREDRKINPQNYISEDDINWD